MASTLGLGALLIPGFGARRLGLADAPRSLWAIRLFGIRELCLAYGLARAAASGDRGQGRLMAEVVNAAQAGDTVLAALLLARRQVSWRLALVIWLGLPPTLLATRAAAGR